MSRATEKELGELHGRVARVMNKALENTEIAQDVYQTVAENIRNSPDELVTELPEVPVVSAPLLSAIAKFLSDNKITAAPEDSKDLKDLQDRLAQKRKKRAVGNVVHMDFDE